jgi:hypothetical protein
MAYTARGSAYTTGPNQETSHAAATHTDQSREHRGRMYLKLLYARGPLTDHEAARLLGMPLSAINSTRNATIVYELVERGHDKRITEYGQAAWTWRLTIAGKASVVAMLPPVDDTPPRLDSEHRGHDLNAPVDGRLL